MLENISLHMNLCLIDARSPWCKTHGFTSARLTSLPQLCAFIFPCAKNVDRPSMWTVLNILHSKVYLYKS